jgi:ankyrin repeat protein
VCTLLLEYGANVNIRDCMGQTPPYIASYCGLPPSYGYYFSEVPQTWVALGAQGKWHIAPPHQACMFSGDEDTIKNLSSLLLESGAKVNIRNRRGETPLHIVTSRRLCNVVQLLLAQGAVDVDAQDKKHSTPLHLVCMLPTWHYNEDTTISIYARSGCCSNQV